MQRVWWMSISKFHSISLISRCLILSHVKSRSALGEAFNFWSSNRIEQNNVFEQVSSPLPAIWMKKNESLPYLSCADPFLLFVWAIYTIHLTLHHFLYHCWKNDTSDSNKVLIYQLRWKCSKLFSLQVNHCHRRWPWLSYWHCCMSVNFLRDTALLTWRSNWGQRSSQTLASPRQIPSKGFVLRKVYRNFKCKDKLLCLCHGQCCYC